MINRKDLVIVLATFCLTVALFMVVPTRSVCVYDPWLDSNHDGKINILDISAVALGFGSTGDPTINVTVTNVVPEIPVATLYVYSAPFIVGPNALIVHPSQSGLGPGVYETDILVHNPSAKSLINITKKIVVALPENESHQAPIWIGNFTLLPDEDFRIDSQEISSYVDAATTLYVTVKGFVCIIAPSPYLDVIAFYTVSEVIRYPNWIGPPSVGNTTSIESLTIAPKPYA